MKHANDVLSFKRLFLLGVTGLMGAMTAGSALSSGTPQGGFVIAYYSDSACSQLVGRVYYEYAACPPGVPTPSSFGQVGNYKKEYIFRCDTLSPIQPIPPCERV